VITAALWHGAKYIIEPALFLAFVYFGARALAWFVKAKRGY